MKNGNESDNWISEMFDTERIARVIGVSSGSVEKGIEAIFSAIGSTNTPETRLAQSLGVAEAQIQHWKQQGILDKKLAEILTSSCSNYK